MIALSLYWHFAIRYENIIMIHNDIQIIIMAGGVGSRFWPMSTPDYPKQFIDVMGVGRSLIQLTVDRLKPICPVENMWVVTNEKYIRIVKEQIPDMPVDNILAEPEALQYRSMYCLCLLEDPEEAS